MKFLTASLLILLSFSVFSQNPKLNPNLKSLGAPVNTLENNEFAPTISPDGSTLVFETDRGGVWKLYTSNQVRPNVWSKPVEIDIINKSIEPGDFLGGPCYSYDGKFLYFTSNKKGGIGGIDIWYSELVNNVWSAPKNVGKPVNTSGYDGFPSLSPDGSTIYFMRSAPAIKEGQRCYKLFSAKRNGKYFSNPIALPYPVNSGCEGYPRIMSDGKTLIFSSARTGGKGAFDLYESRIKYGKWTQPVALDFINTKVDDELISVPTSGDIIYLSNTMSNAQNDIYRVEIPQEFRPENIMMVEGFIKDSETKKSIPAVIRISDIKSKEKIIEIKNDSLTGKYQILLEQGKKYDFSVTSKGSTFYSEVINLEQLDKSEVYKKEVALKVLKPNTTFTLNNIFFEFNSAELNESSSFELMRLIELLTSNPKIQVEISAHTDDQGTDEYNIKLSQSRAESVVKFLSEKGIAIERLVPKGYGETVPFVPNDTEENRAKNRRVEFKVLKI